MDDEKNWTAGEVLAGIKEKPASERGTYPRFTVFVDGERFEYDTKAQLNRMVTCIYSTAPRVFINAGKGVTVDFDRGQA